MSKWLIKYQPLLETGGQGVMTLNNSKTQKYFILYQYDSIVSLLLKIQIGRRYKKRTN